MSGEFILYVFKYKLLVVFSRFNSKLLVLKPFISISKIEFEKK